MNKELKKISREENYCKEVLDLYQHTINQIDDLFEYQYKSMSHNEIKERVYKYLDQLTKGIADTSIKSIAKDKNLFLRIEEER